MRNNYKFGSGAIYLLAVSYIIIFYLYSTNEFDIDTTLIALITITGIIIASMVFIVGRNIIDFLSDFGPMLSLITILMLKDGTKNDEEFINVMRETTKTLHKVTTLAKRFKGRQQ